MPWGGKALIAATAMIGLAGCRPAHEFERLTNGDGTLVVTVDHAASNFGFTRDAIISVQEPRGLAAHVATFGDVEHIEVSWLSPVDLNICQAGKVLVYQTAVTLNTTQGKRTVHVRYGC
jgi:hypothetical protein